MIRAITGTTASKLLVTFFNLLTISMAGHVLGKEGLGIIGLILLGITIILLLNNLVGGAAIVYLVPRIGARSVIIPAYVWAVITAFIFFGVVHFVELVPERYSFHVLALAFIQSLYTANFNVIIGSDRIGPYNVISVLQALITVIAFAMLLFIFKYHDPHSYLLALYASYGFGLVSSMVVVKRCITGAERIPVVQAFKKILQYGIFTQLANAAQMLNYRISYYIISPILGIGELGVYSVGIQISEGTWITPKSMAVVLYMKISNSEDEEYSSRLTVSFIKIGVLITALIMAVLISIPESLYQLIFGDEVIGLRPIMLWLTPGILVMAASQMLSHFFTGTGRHHQNTIGSVIGLVVTIVAGLTLIPRFGLEGAAITASLSYVLLTLYKWVVFFRISKISARHYFPGKQDLRLVREEWKSFKKRDDHSSSEQDLSSSGPGQNPQTPSGHFH